MLDKCLVLYLFVAFLTHYTNSITVSRDLEDDLNVLELIDRHIYFSSDKMQTLNGLVNKVKLSDNSQTNCSQKVSEFWNDLSKESQAAYFDSFGKVGAGILTGNVVYLGYYDQCINIGNTDYCLFLFDVTLTTNTIGFSNTSITIPLEFGMCFPSSCDAKDFYSLFFIDSNEVLHSKSFTADVGTTIHTINVKAPSEYRAPVCPLRELKWTSSSIIVLIVCILLIALVIMGTMVDVSLWFVDDIFPKFYSPKMDPSEQAKSPPSEVKHSINKDEPLINDKHQVKASQNGAKLRYMEFVKDLILSFSLYKTISAIMSTRQPASTITSINGIRVISMLWIILGHTYSFELEFDSTAAMFETTAKRFLFQLVDNFNYSVDSFYVLSGLLLSFLTIKEMERHQGKFPFMSFYIHRLLRLSPANYLIMFSSFKVLPHVGSGPLWIFREINNCEKYWWTNILYINNFYPTSFYDTCYTITWYLSTLMQLFIISPIFLLLLYNFWKIGLATIAGTMFTSFAIIGTLAGIENYNANPFQAVMALQSSESTIYEKPYCRINAYLIGMVLGFVLYKNWKVDSPLWILICFYSVMWIIAVSCLFVVFGQYETWNGHPFTKTENVMFFMFSRTVFSFGIALMIYACHNGFGGVVNKFLSWSFWIPLSRLSFMVYLCHPIVIYLMFRTLRSKLIYTDWLLIVLFAAAVMLSYCMALVLAVTVEYPIANVENAVYKFTGTKRRN